MSNYDPNDGLGGQPTQTMPPPGGNQQPMYPQPPAGWGYGMSPWGRPRRPYTTETKPFFLTSEFGFSLVASILIAITAASSHAFGAWRAWILITAIVVAYTVSRGIAKAGTRSHASDPRDGVDLSRGHDHAHGQSANR